MRRIDWFSFSEGFRDRLSALCNGDVWAQGLSRRIDILSSQHIPADVFKLLVFDQLAETLPGSLDGILRGTLPETLRETLREVVLGTSTYCTFADAITHPEIGKVWETRIDLVVLDRLIRESKLISDARYIRQQMTTRKIYHLSVRNTIELLRFQDDCSIRHALEIKAYMLEKGWLRNNGRTRTHGSELVRLRQLSC